MMKKKSLFQRIKDTINPQADEDDYGGFEYDDIPISPDGRFDNDGNFNESTQYSPYDDKAQNNSGGYQPQTFQTQTQTFQQQSSNSTNNSSSVDIMSGINTQFAAELKLVKPEDYKSVREIADHLINGRIIVLNLEDTNKETARRLIEFMAGVAYTVKGQIQRVAGSNFIIAPINVSVSPEQIKEQSQKNTNADDPVYQY